MRAAIGPSKKIIYTFWVGNVLELRTPGPAKYPTVDDVRDICPFPHRYLYDRPELYEPLGDYLRGLNRRHN